MNQERKINISARLKDADTNMYQCHITLTHYALKLTAQEKPLTTMLATSKNVLITGADDPTL